MRSAEDRAVLNAQFTLDFPPNNIEREQMIRSERREQNWLSTQVCGHSPGYREFGTIDDEKEGVLVDSLVVGIFKPISLLGEERQQGVEDYSGAGEMVSRGDDFQAHGCGMAGWSELMVRGMLGIAFLS
jgi:hypothetical protein